MSYPEAIQFLYDLRLFGIKLGLENAFRLAALAGNPQAGLRFIHVAGTNGKGSTCAMLESIYRAAGLRVGLFTSPHLVSFAERIQVNRRLIDQAEVARLVEEMRDLMASDAFSSSSPTFFEVVTVLALKYFARQKCDLVIWETGLGGRLDATNIVTPLAAVITNVQLDHQQWLGQTVAEIAREKAGIIKPDLSIITAAQDPSALEVISQTARACHAPLTVVPPAAARDLEVSLPGAHQKTNAALALAVARLLRDKIPVSDDALQTGLRQVQWAARLQIVPRPGGQIVLLDAAHNPAGAQTLAAALSALFPGRRPALILGAMRDKDYAAICQILAPLASKILLSPVAGDRTADPRLLAACCRRANPSAAALACENLADAFARAVAEEFIVVTGSIQFIGQAMELLELAPASTERALNEYHPSPLAPPILAVTFDIGHTILQPHPSVGHVYAGVAARHGLEISPDVLNRRFAAAWRDRKNFAHSRAAWSVLVDETFAGLTPVPPSQSFFPELYEAFAAAAAWQIFDDVPPCLTELRRRGIKTGVISNWDERLRPLLRELRLDIWFDSIIISVEVGQPKPAPAIFARAAALLQVAPASILHVGDHRAEDFAGARAAGFQALLMDRGQPGRPPEQIASLAEVIALLDNPSSKMNQRPLFAGRLI